MIFLCKFENYLYFDVSYLLYAMKIERLKKDPVLFRRFLGLSVDRFENLVVLLQTIDSKHEKKRLFRKNRVRRIGGGAPFKHSIESRLALVLLYYRSYVTQEFLGFLFDLNNSTVSRTISHITPLLAKLFKIPEKRIQIAHDDEETLAALLIDGTEQRTYRPQDHKAQKKNYSGKKKAHTLKYQVTTVDGRKIDSISKSFYGSVHDKKMYDKTRPRKPPDMKEVGDTGYQGTGMIHPVKKQKGKTLSEAQKKFNRKISKMRIKAEHAICAMKRYRIAKDV